MMASPDGNVMLYSAASDNFTVSRKDLTALSGAFASSAYNTYVIGNTVFNASLVPQSTLSTSTGATASGFYFLNQGGYLVTATTASGPGTIQNLSSLQTTTVKATAMVEAPLLPSASSTSSSSSSSTGSGSTSAYTLNSFTRTIAPLTSSGTIIVLTTSGFTVLSANYDAATAPPSIRAWSTPPMVARR